mgnify:CR=1 FL=1
MLRKNRRWLSEAPADLCLQCICFCIVEQQIGQLGPGQYAISPGCLAAGSSQDQAFSTGGSLASTVENKNEYWLPSLNLRFGLGDDLFVRFADQQQWEAAPMRSGWASRPRVRSPIQADARHDAGGSSASLIPRNYLWSRPPRVGYSARWPPPISFSR